MLKKKNFNIKISKLLLSITKRIESFFNFLNHSNLNKKKYFNLWRKSLDKNTYIFFGVIFFTVITYFSLPVFYNNDKVEDGLKNEILQKYNFEVKLDKIPQYRLFPKPHYLLQNAKIKYDSKIISNSKNIKVFISSAFKFNKIEIKNLVFTETDFKVNKLDFNFFLTLLNNKATNQKLKFLKSKLFYLDEDDNVIFFFDLKKLNYAYNENLLNEMESKLEVFNLPISLKVKNDITNKIVFSKIKLNSLKLKIENDFNYNGTEPEGELNLTYTNKNQKVRYSLKNKNLIFNTSDKKLMGEINIKPFFLLSNLKLQNIKIKDIFRDNSILINLIKSEIFNNKNLNGKISVAIDNLINLKHVDQIKFDIEFEQGLIFITNLNFMFKNSAIFNFNDVSLIMDENKLTFIGDIVIDFKDIQNFYSHFQIKRNYRRNINQITSNFVFNLDDEFFEFSELKISGVGKKISDQYLNKFNSEKKDLFNKVIFRNTVRNFFKIISLD